ncbi:hypothetical protein ACFLYN_03560 [Chloroflexota bacterium]
MQGINKEYISQAIDELTDLLGIKEDIFFDHLYQQCISDNIKGCVEDIAKYLGLPIVVNLSYVSSSYEPVNKTNRFESNALSQTDKANRGFEGITAQVEIPAYLPFYSSSEFDRFPINIRISEDLINDPSAFIPIIAHELSHIVLHSLRFREKDNEYYTDLTAMILGFSEIMKNARDLVTEVETKQQGDRLIMITHKARYGYLPDDLFDFAMNRIKEIIYEPIKSKRWWAFTINDCLKIVSKYRQELYRFIKYLEYLDRKKKNKIDQEDIDRILTFHQLGYINDIENRIIDFETKINQSQKQIAELIHFTKTNFISLQKHCETAKQLNAQLNSELHLLNKDIKVLEKYVGFLYKIKINRQINN